MRPFRRSRSMRRHCRACPAAQPRCRRWPAMRRRSRRCRPIIRRPSRRWPRMRRHSANMRTISQPSRSTRPMRGRSRRWPANAAAFAKLADDSAALSALSANNGAAFTGAWRQCQPRSGRWPQATRRSATCRSAAELMGKNPGASPASARMARPWRMRRWPRPKFNSLAALSALQAQGKLNAAMQSALDQRTGRHFRDVRQSEAFSALAEQPGGAIGAGDNAGSPFGLVEQFELPGTGGQSGVRRGAAVR